MVYPTNNLFIGNLIKLSAVRASDAEQMALWQEDSDYLRRLDTDFAVPQSYDAIKDEDLKRGNNSNSIQFRLRTIENDCLIGFVALHNIEWNNQSCLLAIGIGNADYRGKGYGKDALWLILRYAFYELNLNRVGLDVISNNIPAIEAYKKVGFSVEGSMRNAVYRDGKYYDRIIMGILRNEWIEIQK
jgi:RimJ/RimL family protein N-acetyltransferase